MDATGISWSKKGWQILHRCRNCGCERRNRVAVDTNQADDMNKIAQLFDLDETG